MHKSLNLGINYFLLSKQLKIETGCLFVNWAQDSFMHGIKEVNKVILMFLSHSKGVINALISNLNNAMAERLNGKIQEVKLIGRGYRVFENFRSAILFFHGGLNLYPQKW
ncbi:MAG: transposase [Tenuifilaceae bacterium]|nr:transposase [Tenuifilaceae bacterium]